MKRKTEPAATPPQPKRRTERPAEVLARAFDESMHNLVLEEGEIAALARRIMRMQRDKVPIDEIKPILDPLLQSIANSMMKQDLNVDPKSGMSIVQIKETPQLKAILREMRKVAA